MAKILVVEDDDLLREIYTDTLLKENFEVESAIDGEDALQKMKSENWDLVLLDIILPKLSGFDVLRAYNNHNLSSAKKIIFLTNLDKEEELAEAKKMGIQYFIKSQLTPGDLLSKIKSSINE